MGRLRRAFNSEQLYEIVFRAHKGIPLVHTDYMNKIVLGILARTQRDNKVTLCHFVIMGNHVHILVVSKTDKSSFAAFYQELKKKITESIKKILGIKHLNLWESSRTSVIQILDIDAAKRKIAYIYNNPVVANIAESITNFRGVSSWLAFKEVGNKIESIQKQTYIWIPSRYITELNGQNPLKYCDKLLKACSKENDLEHDLEIRPNEWMKCFGITDDDSIQKVNSEIVSHIRDLEKQHTLNRAEMKERVACQKRLARQIPTVSGWQSANRSNKIYCIASCSELRKQHILWYQKFCAICEDLYQKWKKGITNIIWPIEAYVPGFAC